ncbi:MAG: GHKL domain-containing protein [Clostridium sp.]|nr:GHKL domain-containing protein [Clostridium sp.]MCM1547102.1 GHKL domain-containing protein [Ruminococcus sp.]
MKKSFFLFLITIAAALVLNISISCVNMQQQNNSVYKAADKMLSAYNYDTYSQAMEDMQKEYDDLSMRRGALAKLNGNRNAYYYNSNMTMDKAREIAGKLQMTDEQMDSRQKLLTYCMERIDYAVSYTDYISDMKNNTANMSNVSIFKSGIYRNITHVRADYYGLENIHISPESDIGVKQLFSDRITDILAVMTALICGSFYSLHMRKNSTGKSNAVVFLIVFSAGTVLLYTANILVIGHFAGIGDLNRAVQSVSDYRSCAYAISVGTLILARTAVKLIALMTLYLLSATMFSAKKNVKFILLAAVITLELTLNITNSRISFTKLFNAENIIGKYGNISISGEYLNITLILSVFCAVLFLTMLLLSFKTINKMILFAKAEAEKKYFDEINIKYNETRSIRHDMKNHLTAVAILLDDGKINEARRYLNEISVEMDNARPPMKTGCIPLDALLFKKISDIERSGIPIDINFHVGFSETTISEYDLCGIFGNILDNAFEACKNLPEEARGITLLVKRQMDMICIFSENNYADINADLSTLKSDKSAHGIGLNRIRRIAEKYGGTVDISAENGVFSISVLLNVN